MSPYTRIYPMLLLILLLAACAPAAPTEEGPLYPDFRLKFERHACFGTCPIYAFTLTGDGTLIYEGQNFVEVMGTRTTQVSQAQIKELVGAFDEADFFELEDRYESQATDLPAITLTLTLDGRTKTIYHYGLTCGEGDWEDQAPQKLCNLEETIEAIPELQELVHGP